MERQPDFLFTYTPACRYTRSRCIAVSPRACALYSRTYGYTAAGHRVIGVDMPQLDGADMLEHFIPTDAYIQTYVHIPHDASKDGAAKVPDRAEFAFTFYRDGRAARVVAHSERAGHFLRETFGPAHAGADQVDTGAAGEHRVIALAMDESAARSFMAQTASAGFTTWIHPPRHQPEDAPTVFRRVKSGTTAADLAAVLHRLGKRIEETRNA